MGSEKAPTPENRSAAASPGPRAAPASAFSTRSSACAVFTWKNDGALTAKEKPDARSRQKPSPSSTSTRFTLREAPASAITRTTDVAPTASRSIFAAKVRGNELGGVQSATSTLPVRSLPRIPTR